MKHKIAILSRIDDRVQDSCVPRRSLVQVAFRGRSTSLAYYNDRFDLHPGDRVYVEGKLAGQQGRVEAVNYNFKIKLSDYKRVIALVDTRVQGKFFSLEPYFVTFQRTALPPQKAKSWFLAPDEEEEYLCGRDESAFCLDRPEDMQVSPAAAERGRGYYREGRVPYLCLDGIRGYAIVEGSRPYEVEFECRQGQISALTCSCWCSCPCKHEFAAMLQLRDLLREIEARYGQVYARTGYFSAVGKETLFTYGVEGPAGGCLTLK